MYEKMGRVIDEQGVNQSDGLSVYYALFIIRNVILIEIALQT